MNFEVSKSASNTLYSRVFRRNIDENLRIVVNKGAHGRLVPCDAIDLDPERVAMVHGLARINGLLAIHGRVAHIVVVEVIEHLFFLEERQTTLLSIAQRFAPLCHAKAYSIVSLGILASQEWRDRRTIGGRCRRPDAGPLGRSLRLTRRHVLPHIPPCLEREVSQANNNLHRF